jgi:hypothetical protein
MSAAQREEDGVPPWRYERRLRVRCIPQRLLSIVRGGFGRPPGVGKDVLRQRSYHPVGLQRLCHRGFFGLTRKRLAHHLFKGTWLGF